MKCKIHPSKFLMKIRSWASRIDRWQHMPCKSHRYWIQSQQLSHLMYHWPFGHVVVYLVTVSSLTDQIYMKIWNHASWLSLFIKVCTYLLASSWKFIYSQECTSSWNTVRTKSYSNLWWTSLEKHIFDVMYSKYFNTVVYNVRNTQSTNAIDSKLYILQSSPSLERNVHRLWI